MEGDFGTVRVSVKWPDRDLARYSTQALPQAANSLHLRLARKADDAQVAETLVARESGAATATASLRVKAETGLELRARAYRASQPNLASDPVLAEATADIDVVRSQVTTASLKPKIRIQGDVSTYAGGYPTVDGAGLAARFYYPTGMVRDPNTGDLYIGDNFRVRKMTPGGIVTTIAGGQEVGNANGPATEARFWGIECIARDATGNLFVGEGNWGYIGIRKIAPDGSVSAYAGVDTPQGIAVDGDGNLYVASSRARRVYKVDTARNITVIAGSDEEGYVDAQGTAARFGVPSALARAADGTLYVGEQQARIRKIDTAGNVTTVRSTNGGVYGLFVDSDGTIYYASDYEHGKIASDGTFTRLLSPQGWEIHRAFAIVPDGAGNLLVTDSGNARIRKRDAQGNLSTVAGSDQVNGSLEQARFVGGGIVSDGAGTLFLTQGGWSRLNVRKITPEGVVSTYAGGRCCGSNEAMPASDVGFYSLGSIARDGSGSLYVSEPDMGRIRKFRSDGYSTALVPSEGIPSPGHLLATATGELYCTVPGGDLKRIGQDGAVAHVASRLCGPMALDPGGDLYCFGNYKVYRVATDGTATVYAGSGEAGYADGPKASAKFGGVSSIAFDAFGNLFLMDGIGNGGDSRTRLRKVGTDGEVSTVAGGIPGHADGQGLAARFYGGNLAYDWHSGRLYVSDSSFVRRVE
ncbi:MAG: hypothetical protein FJZ01_25650 [Candidatus Sericytochromatia bacterium]|nr:hypothetical protein [Candidatus Tanganyikabacteria bacterium]